MKRRLCQLFGLLIVGSLAGCLEFEEQTMSYHHDVAGGSLRIYQDYRGIYGSDAEGKAGVPLSAAEQNQLVSVIEGQRTFFFANWIFEYDRESVVSARADLDALREKLNNPEECEDVEIAEKDIPKFEKLYDLLLAQVKIENGPFYLDGEGKLCGVQSVSVGKPAQIVAALNECAPALLEEFAANEGTTPADRKAVAKFRAAADKGIVKIDGNALVFRWPISRASYDREFGPDADGAATIVEMRKAGMGISFADDAVKFTLGKKDDKITRLTLSSSEGPYTPNAIAPARKMHKVKERFDPDVAARAFLLRK